MEDKEHTSRIFNFFSKVDAALGPSKLKHKPACSDLREMLIECVLESDCMRKDGGDYRYCVQQGINKECKAIRHDWYLCRKSQVDWTKHFSKDEPH